ncbi:MAG TPA: triose-phosphate isomerase family protein [Candidatus Paceibacterota bacterium]|jgi:triosephosphate isomerase
MILAANWKAYVEDTKKAKALAATVKRLALKSPHTFIIAPSSAHLALFAKAGKKNFQFAAQDMSVAAGGAATGETTAVQLKNLGVAYAIIGHSERRAMGETDAEVSGKVVQALAQKITPILCIGERVRDADATYLQGLRLQLSSVLSAVAPNERGSLVIAYEPVWAIGRSAREALSPGDLAEMVLYIRKVLAEHLPARAAAKVPVLYGGSVEPGNIRDLAEGGRVDGFLIGHASVDSATFSTLVKQVP